MFGRHKAKKHGGGIVVIFRLLLSGLIFLALLGGIYSAYKHFSGVDPLKLSPSSLVNQFSNSGNLKETLNGLISSILPQSISSKITRNSNSEKSSNPVLENLTDKSRSPENSNLVLRFLIVADSHSDNINLKEALSQSKEGIKFVIGLGDYTEVGTIDELNKAKQEFDSSGLRYFLVPGDHDLWDSRNRSLPPNENFRQVFGPSYQSFTEGNFRLILLYNSDNYRGLEAEQMNWLDSELKSANSNGEQILVFLHEPLYHPSSDHMMGRVEPSLKDQAQQLISKLSEHNVKKVFAGDTHFFTEYVEAKTSLPMVTIGAVSSLRNPQLPRFAIVSVYEDGSTKVEDVEVK